MRHHEHLEFGKKPDFDCWLVVQLTCEAPIGEVEPVINSSSLKEELLITGSTNFWGCKEEHLVVDLLFKPSCNLLDADFKVDDDFFEKDDQIGIWRSLVFNWSIEHSWESLEEMFFTDSIKLGSSFSFMSLELRDLFKVFNIQVDERRKVW